MPIDKDEVCSQLASLGAKGGLYLDKVCMVSSDYSCIYLGAPSTGDFGSGKSELMMHKLKLQLFEVRETPLDPILALF